MSLTSSSVAEIFAPLSNGNAPVFFGKSVSPDVKWTFGAPGSTHQLAGTYEGLHTFVGAVLQRVGGLLKAPSVTTLESSIVDASGSSAAIILRTVAEAKSGMKLDERACWIIKEKDGKLVEIISFVDSALLEKLIEENKEHFVSA